MKKFFFFFLILMSSLKVNAQDCIAVDPVACLMECIPVTYTGSAPASATYTWSSTCGTFSNPNQQDPGNLCLPFLGTCTIQLIVEEVGMTPDTCIAEVIVFPNPSGLIEGDTTICSGDCAPIGVQFFAGTPPFAYQISDGFITNFYTSPGLQSSVVVCPIFTTTYTLISISDAFGCMSSGPFNEITIDVVPGIMGSVTQTGNMLCANPPGQNYQWWDCGFTQLKSISQCYTFPSNGCYCVILSDANTGCVDTVCNDYVIPCSLTCDIIAADTACFGDIVEVVYSGNASDTASFQWSFQFPTGPPVLINDLDSVSITLDAVGCVYVELIVTDGNCESVCYDTICTAEHLLFATLYENIVTCDSCTAIPIGLDGTPPYTIYISNGSAIDTITGILEDQFEYIVCPEADTTYQYALLGATDSLSQCEVILGEDSIMVTRYSQPIAHVTQTDNTLCADTVLGTYAWYDCGFTQLLSTAICFDLTQTGCYCLVVTNGTCSDTLCGEYIYDPCNLTCSIDLVPNACIGDSIVFAYVGNASSGAIFDWLIDLPGFPATPFTGNDTVLLMYSQPGCFQVSLTVFDLGCISTCSDSICIDQPNSIAAICCDEVRCDTCTDLSIGLSGIPPWTIFIGDGNSIDTIGGIATSPYLYHVCPPADSTITYTLLGVQDTVNTCPGYITGVNSALITLHPKPVASIVQTVDTLCAFPSGMNYGWYSCPSGSYLDTSRCFVPTVSGCYCVDVSTIFDCVDTACMNIILTSSAELDYSPFSLYPNPFLDMLEVTLSAGIDLPVTWVLWDSYGQKMESGVIRDVHSLLKWNRKMSSGIYFFQMNDSHGKMYTGRLFHQ